MDTEQLSNLIGSATIEVWGDLPRDLQEAIFEIAARGNPEIRGALAVMLHERHPKTVHPPRPSVIV
jgi:hypothetical protein